MIDGEKLISLQMESHHVTASTRVQDVNQIAVLRNRIRFAAEGRHPIGKRQRGPLNPEHRDFAASCVYSE